MRDGTWKGLPLPYGWKAALKACDREAECGDLAVERVTYALARDLRNELSSAFVRRLLACEEDRLLLLPGFDTAERLAPERVLEHSVAARFSQLERGGATGDGLAQRAMEAACKDWLARHERHVRQYCICEEGAAAGTALRAFTAAVAAVDVAAVARGRLAGERLPRAAPRRAIDMNEDLTRPR
jgi:hypothetical protein